MLPIPTGATESIVGSVGSTAQEVGVRSEMSGVGEDGTGRGPCMLQENCILDVAPLTCATTMSTTGKDLSFKPKLEWTGTIRSTMRNGSSEVKIQSSIGHSDHFQCSISDDQCRRSRDREIQNWLQRPGSAEANRFERDVGDRERFEALRMTNAVHHSMDQCNGHTVQLVLAYFG